MTRFKKKKSSRDVIANYWRSSLEVQKKGEVVPGQMNVLSSTQSSHMKIKQFIQHLIKLMITSHTKIKSVSPVNMPQYESPFCTRNSIEHLGQKVAMSKEVWG